MSFAMCAFLSVRPHGTTLSPLDGIPQNLLFIIFQNLSRKGQVSLKDDKNNGYLT
jgi:hypothetical protein